MSKQSSDVQTIANNIFENAPRSFMRAQGAPSMWPMTNAREWFNSEERKTIKANILKGVLEWKDEEVKQVMSWSQVEWENYYKSLGDEAEVDKSILLYPSSDMSPEERKQLEAMTVGKKNQDSWKAGTTYYQGGQHYQGGSTTVISAKATPTTFKFGGITVTAGAYRDIKYLGAYDVLIDLTNGAKPAVPIKIIGDLAGILTLPEPRNFMSVDWPDMGVLPLPRQFYRDLYDYLKKCKGHLGVGCMAGQGRTGTVLVALYMVATDKDMDTALAHIRKVYSPHAVETEAQKEYLRSL